MRVPPMTTFKKLYKEIKLREATDLSARVMHIIDVATGSYRRRLPVREMTASEFLKALKYGAAETIEDFLKEHDEHPVAWRDVPAALVTEDILSKAGKLIDQRVEYPGGEFLFRDQIDWHHALDKNASWPRRHWSKIPYRHAQQLGDVKTCWEMNRHQTFPALALAALASGEAKYIAALQRFINGWCDQNPPETGVNYVSNLEIGLRCISWIFTDRLLRHAPGYAGATKERLHRNVYSQARHIAEYISYTERTGRNNHLIGDAASLAFIALAYPEFQESEKWLARGLSALWGTLDEQVFQDGMHFEGSFGYHLFVTEFILILFTELRRQKRPIPPKCNMLLEKMVDVLLRAQQPDGELPNINDNDNGFAMPLPLETAERLKGLFASAAVLYHRPDFKAAAGASFNIYAWLLLGEGGDMDFRVIPDYPLNHAPLAWLRQSGLAVMRNIQGDFALLKNNPDPFPRSGHNHADLLSFLLMMDGKPVLVDAGTFRYNAAGGFRDALRTTAAHNTVTVDGASQAETARSFGWTSLTKARESRAWEEQGAAIADANHYSYDVQDVRHRRVILWIKDQRAFAVIDRLEGAHAHHFEQHWHFPCETRLEDAGHHHYRLIAKEGLRAQIRFFRDGEHDRHEIIYGSDRNKWSYVSRRYGEISSSMTLRHTWSSNLTPDHATHRITIFSAAGEMPEATDISHGVFRIGRYIVDLTHPVAMVTKV